MYINGSKNTGVFNYDEAKILCTNGDFVITSTGTTNIDAPIIVHGTASISAGTTNLTYANENSLHAKGAISVTANGESKGKIVSETSVSISNNWKQNGFERVNSIKSKLGDINTNLYNGYQIYLNELNDDSTIDTSIEASAVITGSKTSYANIITLKSSDIISTITNVYGSSDSYYYLYKLDSTISNVWFSVKNGTSSNTVLTALSDITIKPTSDIEIYSSIYLPDNNLIIDSTDANITIYGTIIAKSITITGTKTVTLWANTYYFSGSIEDLSAASKKITYSESSGAFDGPIEVTISADYKKYYALVLTKDGPNPSLSNYSEITTTETDDGKLSIALSINKIGKTVIRARLIGYNLSDSSLKANQETYEILCKMSNPIYNAERVYLDENKIRYYNIVTTIKGEDESEKTYNYVLESDLSTYTGDESNIVPTNEVAYWITNPNQDGDIYYHILYNDDLDYEEPDIKYTTNANFDALFEQEGVYTIYTKIVDTSGKCADSDVVCSGRFIVDYSSHISATTFFTSAKPTISYCTYNGTTYTPVEIQKLTKQTLKYKNDEDSYVDSSSASGELYETVDSITSEQLETLKVGITVSIVDSGNILGAQRLVYKIGSNKWVTLKISDFVNSTKTNFVLTDTSFTYYINYVDVKYYTIKAYSESDRNCQDSQNVVKTLYVKYAKSYSALELLSKAEELEYNKQPDAKYAIDLAWIENRVITDDTSVYQALINILSTVCFERVFNPKFGVTITQHIGDLASELNADSLVQELKTEVEALDNRIYINDARTNVIYVDKSNTLIFNIYWMNKYSKSYDQIAFGYDLSSAV